MAGHTRGPWLMESPNGNVRATVVLPRNGGTQNTHILFANLSSGATYEERMANCRLASSAPDLLTAATAAKAAMDHVFGAEGHDDNWIYDEMGVDLAAGYFALRHAIAKAEGK